MSDYDAWRKNRYKLFNEKINSFRNHPRYAWLRKYADDAMKANESYGYAMICGEDFIKRIETMSIDFIRDWMDGKNQLEWKLWNQLIENQPEVSVV